MDWRAHGPWRMEECLATPGAAASQQPQQCGSSAAQQRRQDQRSE